MSIDGVECVTFFLNDSKRITDFSAQNSMELNSNLFDFQFDALDNGTRTSKLLQVFSKQAPMIDALITHFVEQMKRRRSGENGQPPENIADGKFPTFHDRFETVRKLNMKN